MPALASTEDLIAARHDLEGFARDNPDGFRRMTDILAKHRMIGYKNIAKLAMGKTPEELKG